MGLLARHRRYLAIPTVAALLVFWAGIVLPDLPAPPGATDRLPPAFWQHAAEAADPYINGHYGFRGLIMAANRAVARTFKLQQFVLVGEKGQLFFASDRTLEKVFGEIVADETSLETTERVARAISDVQSARGGQFVMISPPDVSTIQADLLPPTLRSRRRSPNTYDLVMARLGQAGVNVIDLRPILEEAKRDGPVQRRTDTHWNQRGALIAYNATMNAFGRADLTLDPAVELGSLKPVQSGDLARIAGQKPTNDDSDYDVVHADEASRDSTAIADPGFAIDPGQPMPSYAVETNHSGPALLVIGDSYTRGLWRAFVDRKFGRIAWVNHDKCLFSWDAVKNFHADYVILEMTERLLPCDGLPKGFPAPRSAANESSTGTARR